MAVGETLLDGAKNAEVLEVDLAKQPRLPIFDGVLTGLNQQAVDKAFTATVTEVLTPFIIVEEGPSPASGRTDIIGTQEPLI